jgi:outer membrane lipoprotein LolB
VIRRRFVVLPVRVPLAAALVALLGGCATRPTPDAGAAWTSGRLSLRVQADAGGDGGGDGAARSLSAGFDLRGDGERGELRLSSPLGGVIAVARWAAGEAVLDTGAGPVAYPDLDSLSRHALGEPLPLRALPDWLAGRPWAGAASRAIDGGFEQLGWLLHTAERAAGRIDAERPAPPRIVLRLRVESAE